MTQENGNNTATDSAFRVIPCKLRGEPRWKIEIGSGWNAGRRKRKLFKTEVEALKFAREAGKERKDVGKAWSVLTPPEKVTVMTILKEITEAGFTLEEVWHRAKGQSSTPKASCTLQRAVAEVLEVKRQARCRTIHIDNMEWYLGKFIAGRTQADISTIGEQEIADWFAARKEAPRSQKQHMGILSALFTHAWRRRYISENPVNRMDKVFIDRKIPSMLTLRQCWSAITWARRRRPQFLAYLVLTLFLGMRPMGEAAFITWDNIDLNRKRIVIDRSKTRTPRIIDLDFCPVALAWLRVAKETGSLLPLSHTTRVRMVRELRKRLKFKRWPQVILRHTAASNLIAFHQDAGKVAAFMGNSAGTLLKNYKVLVFKEDAEKWMRLTPRARHLKLDGALKPIPFHARKARKATPPNHP